MELKQMTSTKSGQIIVKMKRKVIDCSYHAQEGHIPSAFSILDILWVLYDQILKINPKNPEQNDRDIFVLSKGHAALGLYVVLVKKRFFPAEYLKEFAEFSSILGGHPDSNKVPGVEASTGSLGHGFPMAVGMALGIKIKKAKNRVFVLIGDGECNEGTIWESALLAAHHKLNNLCCIIDYNHSTDRALMVGDLESKFKAFGWQTKVINGHHHQEIHQALKKIDQEKPLVVIAQTIKGFGSKSMENNPAWHHKSPTEEELKIVLGELT